ncbi:MAG: aspartyl-tRNA(Asn)/glutamyl-tRNA(Gln) amidotransferase subunit [Desulfonauticus sp.]|jgi:aspartyl-tRNA(Asn)/glutamyl-tRNA(Gln) amidotransferase subunit C|nr:MAG: Aspartyl/glutamyl-tRNA(Asn/Gln) amidotransferase subunit C [Desulfonauticus sp. 38_4375]MDK2921181.1 aspartyl-tRNA(Asn)/glutamyl-tRNA(Gln) amidotransferase subunit [Desulfonauticus sp.]
MKITKEEVKQIATLARLKLPEEKVEIYQKQFSAILDYMEKLKEIDTKEVNPLYSPAELKNVFREDEVKKDLDREEILKNAPKTDGEFFIVPKII